ncbi:MAG: glycosyltransferase family 39 protein [Atopobiaceae bacterium]|nr:glycosyltransferase family 39 protein [Atopobiaceae bacterium]
MHFLPESINRRSVVSLTCVILCFCALLLVALHNLTHAGLWFDETIEYWYSKVLVGPLPFESSSNMYERINTTFQPPLYNVVMHFWLMLGDSEWWFRFLGVVMAFVAGLGLYFTLRRLWCHFAACASVLFMAFTFQLVVFWQECAEYNLLIAVLFWLLYAFVRLLQDPSQKNICLFVGLSIMAIYTHYGASFAVVGLAIAALIQLIRNKQPKLTLRYVLTGVLAIALFVVPLYLFFFRAQLAHISAGDGSKSTVPLSFFYYLFGALEVFRFDFASFVDADVSKVLFAAFVLVIAVALVSRKSPNLWLLAVANVVCYTLYYLAVTLGVYAHGEFSRRYVLFFSPLWIVLLFEAVHALLSSVEPPTDRSASAAPFQTAVLHRASIALSVCLLLAYCSANWALALHTGEIKQTVRDCTKAWLACEGNKETTLVNYVAESGFAYYIRQDSRFSESLEDKITYVPSKVGKLGDEERREYLLSALGDELPKSILIVKTQNTEEIVLLANMCADLGYTHSEVLYEGYASTLTRLSLDPINNSAAQEA